MDAPRSDAADAKPKKQQKLLTTHERIANAYRRLESQIDSQNMKNAIKTTKQILLIAPTDALAFTTQIQLLIHLADYPTALSLLPAPRSEDHQLQYIYCLYKTGREAEALTELEALDDEAREGRTARLMEAQVLYRLQNYAASQDIFSDLLDTADVDSPESTDLQTNLSTLSLSLSFLTSIPSLLARAPLPPIDQLESTPLHTLLKAHPLFISAAPQPVSSTPLKAGIGKKPRRVPKNFEMERKPDPERWLPKRERKGYGEEMGRRKGGREKEKAGLTQGGLEEGSGKGGAGGGGGGGGKKKGKGKK